MRARTCTAKLPYWCCASCRALSTIVPTSAACGRRQITMSMYGARIEHMRIPMCARVAHAPAGAARRRRRRARAQRRRSLRSRAAARAPAPPHARARTARQRTDAGTWPPARAVLPPPPHTHTHSPLPLAHAPPHHVRPVLVARHMQQLRHERRPQSRDLRRAIGYAYNRIN